MRPTDGVVVTGNPAFPVNKGALCIKGFTSGETLRHPDRLRTPLVRNSDGRLAPASWDEALDRIAAGVRATQESHGPHAVGVFGGGSLTNEKTYLLGKFARVALGTRNVDYNGRFCMSSAAGRDQGVRRRPGTSLPGRGHRAGATSILLVGSNPAETMPPLMQYFQAQRAAGGTLIVVDPRRTLTAQRRRRCTCGLTPGLRRRARERPAPPPAARRHDRSGVHRRAHRRLRGAARRDRDLLARAHREGHGHAGSGPRARSAAARRREAADGAHRARRGAAVAGREQRPRIHQSRPRAGATWPAVRRLRHDHRPGKRPGRPRARAEGRPASRLSSHRRSGGARAHRVHLGDPRRGDSGTRVARRTSSSTTWVATAEYARCS